jgi:hypothetical protein
VLIEVEGIVAGLLGDAVLGLIEKHGDFIIFLPGFLT